MHILLVEDDLDVAESIRFVLEAQGYRTTSAFDLQPAWDQLRNITFDLVLLDISLPGGSGLDILRRLREEQPHIPVIIITAQATVETRVLGLDEGADDYIVKPFAPSELLARIGALLRRSREASRHLCVGALEMDLVNRSVTRDGQKIELTPQEFQLAEYLVRLAGESVTCEMIARDCWDQDRHTGSVNNLIRVHISHLRQKIDKGYDVKLIHTLRGKGFMMKAPS